MFFDPYFEISIYSPRVGKGGILIYPSPSEKKSAKIPPLAVAKIVTQKRWERDPPRIWKIFSDEKEKNSDFRLKNKNFDSFHQNLGILRLRTV